MPIDSGTTSPRGSGHHSARSFQSQLVERKHGERRVRDHVGQREERHAEPRRDRLAVALVGDEQLQHGRRLAERRDALHRLRLVDRVDEPHAAVVDERVGGALERALHDPGHAQRMFG